MEVGGQLHAPAVLPHCTELQKTLKGRLGAPPGQTARFGVKKKNDWPIAEIELRFLGGPARSLVTTLTKLPQYHIQWQSPQDALRGVKSKLGLSIPYYRNYIVVMNTRTNSRKEKVGR